MTDGDDTSHGTSPARLSEPDRQHVSAMLADAFVDDPMQQWLFPAPHRRRPRLRRFYELDLRHRLEGRAVICRPGTDGVAFWHPPGDASTVPVRSALRLAPAFLTVAAHHPYAALRVLGAVAGRRPSEPHWYLSHLAVAPRAQGRGIGSQLLRAGLEMARRDGSAVYLETANPANLPFYSRHGIEVVEAVEVASAPPVWLLRSSPVVRPGPQTSCDADSKR